MAETVAGLLIRRICEVAGATKENPLPCIGVPGDYGFCICDAVEAEPKAVWNGSSNELNAGYCADGYARLNGLAVLVTTYGVGELSAINAVAGSFAERCPVVVITSSPAAVHTGAERILHHTLAHGTDYDLFARLHDGLTAAQAKLTPENAAAEVERVLSVLLTTSLPVYINVPADVGYLPAAPPASPPPPPAAAAPSDPAALAAAVAAVAERWNAALRPAILADIGVLRAHAQPELLALVEALNCPLASTGFGRNCLPETHASHVGVYAGARSQPAGVRALVEEADCLLCVGVNLTDRCTGFFTASLRDEVVLDVKLRRTVVGGAAFEDVRSLDLLRALAAGALRPRAEPWARRGAEDGWLAPAPAAPPPGAPLTSDAIFAALQAELREGDVLVVETGMMSFGLDAVRLPGGVSVLHQYLWGSIGWACPAAGGAALALAARGRGGRVFLVTGDGSLQMSAQHLGCFARDRLPILTIVVNNDGYLLEKLLCKRVRATYNDVPRWKYAELLSVFGADPGQTHTATASTAHELPGAWAAALAAQAAGKTVLLELCTPALDVPSGAAYLVPKAYLDE